MQRTGDTVYDRTPPVKGLRSISRIYGPPGLQEQFRVTARRITTAGISTACHVRTRVPRGLERAAVVGHSEVVEVAAHLARQCLPKVREWAGVARLMEPVINGDQGVPKSLMRWRWAWAGEVRELVFALDADAAGQ